MRVVVGMAGGDRLSEEAFARLRALSRRLALPLPEWLPPEELETNWQRASAQRRGRSLLP